MPKGVLVAADGSVTYTETRAKLMQMVALSGGWAALGGLFVWTGGPDTGRGSGPLAMAIVVANVLMALAVFVRCAPRLIGSPRDLLVLDEEGFVDDASVMAAGRVKWSEVTEMALIRIAGRDSIAVRVIDPESVQRRRGPAGRLLSAANKRWADVWISDATMSVPAHEVLAEMQARWKRSTRTRSSDR